MSANQSAELIVRAGAVRTLGAGPTTALAIRGATIAAATGPDGERDLLASCPNGTVVTAARSCLRHGRLSLSGLYSRQGLRAMAARCGEAGYFLCVKGNQAALQRAAFDAILASGPREPDYEEEDRSHGRIVRRSLWVASADGLDFPHAARVARIRRDRCDRDGQLLSKDIVHALTSLDATRATPADLAAIARRHGGIESLHWVRSPGTGLAVASCGADATRVSFSC